MAELSDAELRKELVALGYRPGPITATTRKVYAKKLDRLRSDMAAAKRRGGGAPPRPGRAPARPQQASPSRQRSGRSLGHVGAVADSEDEDDEDEEEEEEERGRQLASRSGTSGESSGLSWRGETRGSPPGRSGGLSARAEGGLSRDSIGGLSSSVQWGSIRRRVDRESKPSSWAGALMKWLPWRSTSDTGSQWQAGQEITARTRLLRAAPKQQTDGKSKGLEYYLSQFLCFASIVLLLIFLGILAVKMMGSGWLDKREESFHLLPADCDHRTDDFCQVKQKDIIMNMLHELYDYLSVQAGNFECGNPENLKSKCIWVSEAKDHVVNVTGSSTQKFEAVLHWILNSNKDVGIWLRSRDLTEPVSRVEDVYCLESAHPQMGFTCRFRRAVVTAIMHLFLFFWGLLTLWGILIFLRYRWRKMEEEEQAMYDMVKKIIAVVQDHYKEWERNLERYPYVGIFHVRDSLIPPQSRKKMKRVWERAVDFLASNESRIQTESHRVAGEDMLVWRWTQPSYVSDSEH
ncbi:LEMD2 protein, partial [Rhinopomastus cyanomelas]|nr:LEMD2 protein [Rhinopomastus cyanomelas]